MKPKTLILMVVAIGCGLVASYMTSRVIADKSDKPVEEKVAVLVARQNIPMGTMIKDPEKLFEEKQFTKGEEPKKAIRSFDDLKNKLLNKPLGAEQFVTGDDLTDKEQGGLPSVMPKGWRAVAIKVDAGSSVGGFVLPHTRVDVVSVVRQNENNTYSKIILQNVLVLAVDTLAGRPEDGKQALVSNTVTLQVTPQQAETLAMARELGTLNLILRAYGDEDKVATTGVTPKGANKGGMDGGDEGNGLAEGGTRHASTQVGLSKIPDVPKDIKPSPTQVADVKPVEPPPPPKTHTLTIYNGDNVNKVIFTLNDKDVPAEVKKTVPAEVKTEKARGSTGAADKPAKNPQAK
jgi:pilus assembly protein CpaB